MEQSAECENLFAGTAHSKNIRKAAHTQPQWTFILILAGVSTTLASATVGYNIGVVNSPAEIIKEFCSESIASRYSLSLNSTQLDVLWSAIVSIFLIGGAIGSLAGSWFADKVGRKGAISVCLLLSACGAVCFLVCKVSNSVELLILGRIFVGLSAGLTTCVVPMYLTELSPLKLRGAVGVLCPLGVTCGVLLGQVMSMSQVLGKTTTWPYLLGFYLLFTLLSTAMHPFLPESPKYLFVIKDDSVKAMESLEKIRNKPQEYLTGDLLDLQAEHGKDNLEEWSLAKLLTTKSLLLPILLVCSMQAGQQFVGINAVFYYSVSIFKTAGLSETDCEFATIGAGLINCVMAIISIETMSKFNRRTLFQLSSISSAFFLALLGVAIIYIETISWMPYLSIVGVLGFVLCYGLGLGPIPYFIGSELFEIGPRPSAMALGSMANWGGNFIIGMTFPTMQATIGPYSFFIFAVIAVLLFVFTRMYLPETRGCDPAVIAHLCKNGLKTRPLLSPVHSLSTDETTPTA